MFEYIFTIGCFDKFHKGHIKLLENMKEKTEKIIIGIHNDDSVNKLKNTTDIDSIDIRKKNLQKYAHDIFVIDDVDPTNAIKQYISEHFNKNINNNIILKNNDNINLEYDNFNLYGTNIESYLSNEVILNYKDNINVLPIGKRAKHFYQDHQFSIYNEREKFPNNYGTLIYSNDQLTYHCEEFDDYLINKKSCGGSEDNRYIIFENELFVVFNGLSKIDKSRQIFLYNIVNNKVVQLYINSFNIKKFTQKNWMPYIYENSLFFIHSICELCVLKLKSFDTGECEIVSGHPSKFNDKGIFGGSNLCHWKNNLYIGFIHSRNPHLCIPFLYDAKNFRYISTYSTINFNLPFTINKKICCGKEEYPYYFRKINNFYELFLSYQVTCSIKYQIKESNINNIFNNLLNSQDLLSINIGSSVSNNKIISNTYNGNLFFIHDHCDTFIHSFKDNNITITRTDKDTGWGQKLIGYKNNWCFIRGDDNTNFPAIDYIKSIMPIQYLPYSIEISATKLRDFKNNKLGIMNYLLGKVVDIIDENNIPYYLDCGTLLGCIRENELMENDTDIDVTIHLSNWDKLKSIDFKKYGLERTRTLEGFPKKEDGNMISVKTEYSNFYCDIYTNPAFPQLDKKILNGKSYNIPLNSELYLTQLYGNWKIPSNKHAITRYHRGKGLVNSEYSKYWDKDFEIFKCIM